MEKNYSQNFRFLFKCGPKYGSTKFDKNAVTRTDFSVSQASYLSSYGTYRVHSYIKWKVFERSIWVSTVGSLITINRSQKSKSKPFNLDHEKTNFFYSKFFSFDWLHHSLQSVKKLEWFLPSFVTISFWIKTELAIFAKHKTLKW